MNSGWSMTLGSGSGLCGRSGRVPRDRVDRKLIPTHLRLPFVSMGLEVTVTSHNIESFKPH